MPSRQRHGERGALSYHKAALILSAHDLFTYCGHADYDEQEGDGPNAIQEEADFMDCRK